MSLDNKEKKENKIIISADTTEANKLLNRKRKIGWQQRNYLIRRLLAPFKESADNKEENEYEKYANYYYLLMAFDWRNEQQIKTRILQNLKPNAFWFYISSNYFPYLYNEFFENKHILNDIIQEFIIDKFTKDLLPKKTSPPSKKKKISKLLNELKEYFADDLKQNTTIENMINLCQNKINQIENYCKDMFEKYVKKDYNLTNTFISNARINENLRMDIDYHSKDIKKFINHLRTKNYDTIGDNEIDDEVCYVCNSGDYEDDNLIVYCSICNIAVHQQCYGIEEVPQDDWICEVCKKFRNPAKNKYIECILCSSKGGALKQCTVSKCGNLLHNFYEFRREADKLILRENTKSKLYENVSQCNASPSDTNLIQYDKNEHLDKNLDLDKNQPIKLNNLPVINENTISTNVSRSDEISEKKEHDEIWVHLSCALWTPEIQINNYSKKEGIFIKDTLTKKRYEEKCDLCLLAGYGPTVKCEKCEYRFHPECARQNKFPLEISTDNKSGESSFHIFCPKHAPYKFLKIRELRRQRTCDEIMQFGDLIKKSVDNHNKSDKENIIAVYNKTKSEKLVKDYSIKKIEISSKDKKNFYMAIREMIFKIASLDSIEIDKNEYEIKQKEINIKDIKFNYHDIKNPWKFPWAMLKQKEEYLANLKNYEIYQLFKDSIKSTADFCKNILKVHADFFSKKSPVKSINYVNPVNIDFCKCHSMDNLMIECCGSNCEYHGWIHPKCFEELAKYPDDIFNADDFTYYCPKCRIKENKVVDFSILDLLLQKKIDSSVNINSTVTTSNNVNK